MRIATWNVNGLRSRQGLLAHWLAARQPDVVALQELKLTDDAVSARRARSARLSRRGARREELERRRDPRAQAARGRCRWACPARTSARAWSRARVEGVSVDERLLPEREGRSRTRTFRASSRGYDALAAHWTASHPRERARAAVRRLQRLSRRRSTAGTRPAFAGTIFHTEDERARFRALLAAGLFDVFRERHPELAGVHVVGLSRRRVPQARGAAHRPPARDAPRARARHARSRSTASTARSRTGSPPRITRRCSSTSDSLIFWSR